MNDPLLFENEITVPIIMQKVSYITDVSLDLMTLPKGTPHARKREYVAARQISMCLSKKYTRNSLATIGEFHGGKDHATVLHACKAVQNGLDTRDPLIAMDYMRADKAIKQWLNPETTQENDIFNTEK